MAIGMARARHPSRMIEPAASFPCSSSPLDRLPLFIVVGDDGPGPGQARQRRQEAVVLVLAHVQQLSPADPPTPCPSSAFGRGWADPAAPPFPARSACPPPPPPPPSSLPQGGAGLWRKKQKVRGSISPPLLPARSPLIVLPLSASESEPCRAVPFHFRPARLGYFWMGFCGEVLWWFP